MSRAGLLQLSSGLAGDMFLGALAGAGADFNAMNRAVGQATGGRAALTQRPVQRGGMDAIKVDVVVDGKPLTEDPGHWTDGHGTSWKTIDAKLAQAELVGPVKARARAVFRRLAEAEARVHGATLETVHFHELGGLDAVADIVGTVAGLAGLQLDVLWHGPVNAGGGTVETAHGRLPVPAPATLELLHDRPLLMQEDGGELLTPTGAALLAECAQPQSGALDLTPRRVGVGAGSRDPAGRPNVARLVVGDTQSVSATRNQETVGVVEASLDDCTPEDLGYVIQRFLDLGALDATVSPLWMKKGRPGFLLRVLTAPSEAASWAERVTRETSTLGARWRVESRKVLPRREDVITVDEGRFRIKVAALPSGDERPHVEYDDLERAARESGVPIADLRRKVERAWERSR